MGIFQDILRSIFGETTPVVVSLETNTQATSISGHPGLRDSGLSFDDQIVASLPYANITVTGGELGPGLKSIIPLPNTDWNSPVCLFVENYLPAVPNDVTLGWTSEEIVHHEGAIIPQDGAPLRNDDGNLRPIYMKSITLEDFLTSYVNTDHARIVTERAMHDMRDQCTLSDDYVRQVAAIWQNRDSDTEALGPKWLN